MNYEEYQRLYLKGMLESDKARLKAAQLEGWRRRQARPPEPVTPFSGVRYITSAPKVMAASSQEFPAESALWERIEGHWICTCTSEGIAWMEKMDASQAKRELALRGFSFDWVAAESIRQRITRIVATDPTTIEDEKTMWERFGHLTRYPVS